MKAIFHSNGVMILLQNSFSLCTKCANFRPKYKLITTEYKEKLRRRLKNDPKVFSLFSTTCCNFANCSAHNELVMNNSTNSIVFASLTVTKRDSSVIWTKLLQIIETQMYCEIFFAPFSCFLFCEAEIVGNFSFYSCYRLSINTSCSSTSHKFHMRIKKGFPVIR